MKAERYDLKLMKTALHKVAERQGGYMLTSSVENAVGANDELLS